MALTINYHPVDYASVNDDLIYTVADAVAVDDPVTYPNFRFIGDVYVGGTLVARLKRIPDPVTGIGIFNVGPVIRNYMATLFDPAPGLVAQALGDTLSHLSIQMKFGEDYSFADHLDITVDTTRRFFNNYTGRDGGPNTSIALFLDSVASQRPRSIQVLRSSGFCFLPYFPTTTALISVTVTPIGGGTPFTTSVAPANIGDMQVFNLAPANINSLHPGAIGPSATGYTVAIGAQTYRFDIICESVYTPIPVHFLNSLGGFETKLFTKVSRYTVDVQRNSFGKQRFKVGSDGVAQYSTSGGVYFESTSVYASQYTEKKIFNTDILNDDEYAWLSDLLLSPMVYVEEPNGDFNPVTIIETSYERKKVVNDDLTNLTITIQYGQTLTSQYR